MMSLSDYKKPCTVVLNFIMALWDSWNKRLSETLNELDIEYPSKHWKRLWDLSISFQQGVKDNRIGASSLSNIS